MSKTIEKSIAGFTGKVVRKHFGRGPEFIYVALNNHAVVILFRRFSSLAEQTIYRKEGEAPARQLQKQLWESILPDIQKYLKDETGLSFPIWFQDSHPSSQSGMVTGLSANAEILNHPFIPSGYEHLKKEIQRVSTKSSASPASISIQPVDPKTLIIIRKGVCTGVEKSMIEEGYREEIERAKWKTEHNLLDSEKLSECLGVKVHDIFLDWDLTNNNSLMVICSEPIHQIKAPSSFLNHHSNADNRISV